MSRVVAFVDWALAALAWGLACLWCLVSYRLLAGDLATLAALTRLVDYLLGKE